MKVLWFANLPCGAAQKLGMNVNIGGWLSSLEEQLVSEDIALSVAFYWGEKLEPFIYKKTTYYPIFRKGSHSKFGRLIGRILDKNTDDAELKQLLETIDLAKPDLIHIHGTENNFGLIQGLVNIPVVVSIQGIISVYAEKYFSGISKMQAILHEKLSAKLLYKSAGYRYRNLKQAAVRELKIYRNTNFFIGRTDWDRRISQLLSPSSQYFIGNEILRGSFYKASWTKAAFGQKIKIATVMSDGLYKGMETIIKTAKLLIDGGQIDFEWIVIGQDESNDLVKLTKSLLKADFEKLNLKFVGSKTENEIVEILTMADIYCQVSHIENSPNSLCEAMLVGMPIIASFAGGTDSMLTHHKEGILVQAGDPYSFAGAIIELSRKFDTAAAYGKAASIKALSRHNRDDIRRSTMNTYREVLKFNN